MIPVQEAPEPPAFNAAVRASGIAHLESQLGPGQRAVSPYWRRALPDLQVAYDHTCAYLGIRVQLSTAFLTVDHFVPKSVAPFLAYEWSNFRLAAQTVNTFKADREVLVDPFSVAPGEFALDLLSGEVHVGVTPRSVSVAATIDVLHLNDARFVDDRRHYIDAYLAGHIDRAHLARWFPFGHAELARQGH